MSLEETHAWAIALFEEKAESLVIYGRSLGLTHFEAEDVVQDTFRSLLQQSPPPLHPKAYLLAAYRNRALNYKRGLFRHITRELESKRWFEPHSNGTEDEEHAVMELTLLPQEQREVIVLKLWHQMTFKEIASHLDLSPNTVAARYRYGIQKIRTSFAQSTTPQPQSTYGFHRITTDPGQA